MAKHLAFLSQQGITTLAQLGDLLALEGIEGAGQDRLLSKLLPPPGASQRQIRAQAGVNLGDGTATSQNTDQDVL